MSVPEVAGTESIGDVSINPDLSNDKREDILELVSTFSDIFTDKPGRTSLIKHNITLRDYKPVRGRPYPLPYATRNKVEGEVKKMLEAGIIDRSSSDYCAPLVLVTKPDGAVRFCVNYKKLNSITKFDNEPMTQPDNILS